MLREEGTSRPDFWKKKERKTVVGGFVYTSRHAPITIIIKYDQYTLIYHVSKKETESKGAMGTPSFIPLPWLSSLLLGLQLNIVCEPVNPPLF